MKVADVPRDELVYRALIDACGRCGSTDHAMEVLAEMQQSGIVPDSVVYGNLVRAFSMNGDLSRSLFHLQNLLRMLARMVLQCHMVLHHSASWWPIIRYFY